MGFLFHFVRALLFQNLFSSFSIMVGSKINEKKESHFATKINNKSHSFAYEYNVIKRGRFAFIVDCARSRHLMYFVLLVIFVLWSEA